MLGIKLLPLAVAASAVPQVNRRLDNGVGVTPAMGWNGWVYLHFLFLLTYLTIQHPLEHH